MTEALAEDSNNPVRRISRVAEEAGASAVEYSILAGFIAAVLIVAVVFLGQETQGSYDCTKDSIENGDARC